MGDLPAQLGSDSLSLSLAWLTVYRRWVIYRCGGAAIHCLFLARLTVYRRWVIYQGRSKSNNLLDAGKSHSPPVNHAHCLSVSLFRSLSLPLTLTLARSQCPSHTLSLARSVSLSHLLLLTHSLPLTLSLSLARRKIPPRPRISATNFPQGRRQTPKLDQREKLKKRKKKLARIRRIPARFRRNLAGYRRNHY